MSALRTFNFDPLESLDELKSSGIGEKQARAFISLVKKSTNSSFESLASKEDLVLAEARLENKITEVKSELKQDIAEIKGSVNLLSKLFFGSVLLIMVDIAVTLLHHT